MELNADLLAEMIMEDLTQEVAEDLGKTLDENEAAEEATRMQQAPSLETIIQRLEEMEVLKPCRNR